MSDEPTKGRPPDPEEEIFEACLARPIEERAGYLDRVCAGDAALRRKVEELLRSHSLAESFLEGPKPAADVAQTIKLVIADLPSENDVGKTIGRYKLLQQIGEGGCGTVYMAEQQEPVSRRVALKVIKLGMDTKSVIARFEAERQALALMDHPNIAKVLDAGATDNGRPYFVMELVRGIKITEYCDQHNLTTQARLDLFVQVCHAVQHAHQKGIIHRDIKPSNILVTMSDGVPVPKVIDFGIAKATQGKLTNHTLFTAFEQFIGTPAYMSPEQAEMSALDIDTRSDLYSLGVLLYELLTGKTPFDAHELLQAGIDEMRRQIREKEPSKPSTRLSTMLVADLTDVAAHRQSAPPKLVHLIRGDLDWIVMKCLEKDRTRRYETANGLAADIRRHINNEPVVASPPSNAYRLQKFVRRNRAGVLAGSLVLLTLLIGIVGTTWGWVAALHQKREAERQGRIAKHTTEFLTGMFESIDPQEAKLREITVREILDQASSNIGSAFPNDPMTELPIRRTMMDIYDELGKPDASLTHAEAALRLVQVAYGDKDSPEKEDSLSYVAKYLDEVGRFDEALPMFEKDLAMCRGIYKGDNTNVANGLNNLGHCLVDLGRFSEAMPKFEEALAMDQRIYKGDHPDVAKGLSGLSSCLHSQGRYAEALPKYEEVLAMFQRIYKGDHPEVARALINLADCLIRLDRYAEALPHCEMALAMDQRIYKGDHPEVAAGLNHLAGCLYWLARPSEALPNFEQALEMRRRIYKGDHPDVVESLDGVGSCLHDLGRYSEELTNREEALAIYQGIYKSDHPAIAAAQDRLAECLRVLHRFDEALPRYKTALAMYERIFKGDNASTEGVLNNYALALDQAARSAEALLMREADLAMCRRLHPEDNFFKYVSQNNLALCLEHLGRWPEALTNYEAAVAMVQRLENFDDPMKARFQNHVGDALNVVGRSDEAAQQYQESLALLQRVILAQPGNNSAKIDMAKAHQKLGDVLVEMGKAGEATTNYQEGLRVAEAVLASDASNPDAKPLRLTCRIKLGLEKVEVVVHQISPQSQALEIGLREGDVLVRYAGKPVLCASDLPLMTGRNIESSVELEIRRDGAPLKLPVKAGPLGAVCEDQIIATNGL